MRSRSFSRAVAALTIAVLVSITKELSESSTANLSFFIKNI